MTPIFGTLIANLLNVTDFSRRHTRQSGRWPPTITDKAQLELLHENHGPVRNVPQGTKRQESAMIDRGTYLKASDVNGVGSSLSGCPFVLVRAPSPVVACYSGLIYTTSCDNMPRSGQLFHHLRALYLDNDSRTCVQKDLITITEVLARCGVRNMPTHPV